MKTTLGTLEPAVKTALSEMNRMDVVKRIWAGDHTVWKPDPEEIVNRLGWLTVAGDMMSRLEGLNAFVEEVKSAGYTDVVLLGMGGSSLGAEALRASYGRQEGYPCLHVLDSTVPAWVDRVTRNVDLAKTLFVVASKSGGTTEVMAFFKHFWALTEEKLGGSPGRNFVAVTDPGSSLARLGKEKEFREVFLNPPDIGGRYSVLSLFGLVAAALCGIRVRMLLEHAEAMALACAADTAPGENPGAHLGAVLGVASREGRDKATLLLSPGIACFGLWAEQLVAESTGKEGRGVLPVVGEPFAAPDRYGPDRLFVAVRLDGDDNALLDRQVEALKAAGHPMVEVALASVDDLGGEFFRWELATAVAGSILGIQPFDQPDVQEAKDSTKKVLAAFEEGGKLPEVEAGEALDQLLDRAGPGAYVAIMAYTDRSEAFEKEMEKLRRRLLEEKCLPTTFGYGPRFLHSTGQLHKGDAGGGLFLQLVARVGGDLPVPGEAYSFGVLVSAQALGDLQTLRARNRKVVRVDLGHDPAGNSCRLL